MVSGEMWMRRGIDDPRVSTKRCGMWRESRGSLTKLGMISVVTMCHIDK